MATNSKGGGGRLTRSEITTVRLDPKLKYLAELAARKQRRTLSSFIEWSIEESLRRFPIQEGDGWDQSFMAEAEKLWDVDEADRLAKLALNYPELLTHEEQLIWKLVKENGFVWKGAFNKTNHMWTWSVREDALVFHNYRKYYDVFKGVVAGDITEDKLPTWTRVDPKVSTGGFDDIDDDIPF